MSSYSQTILNVNSGRILLVEGRDEVNFFNAFLRSRFGKNESPYVQVLEVGGKDGFRKRLSSIVRDVAIKEINLQVLGVVRDADDNPASSLESIQNSLKNEGFCFPQAHAEFCGKDPSVGIFIVPDGGSEGALETLCRRSVSGSPRAFCVESYLECLDKHEAIDTRPNGRDKTFAHAYLAASSDPVARVGEGAQKGDCWDFDNDAFSPLAKFLERLVNG